jgi:large subunit ribosomal protein L19
MLGGNSAILNAVTKDQIRAQFPLFDIGDTIAVSFRIVEGDKERQQVFQGVIIGRAGSGITEMLTDRKIVDEVGVERIFPLSSPMVAKIEVVRRADARRAKLYYLRDRAGKSRRLRDRRRGMKHVANPPAADAPKA